MKGFNYKKAVQSLAFLANRLGGDSGLNKMKAIKLIWLSDRLHLNRYGRTISGDVYFALPFGPVPSTTRDLMEGYANLSEIEKSYSELYISSIDKHHYKAIEAGDNCVFSLSEIQVLQTILENYGSWDHFKLSEFSHKFPEWRKYEAALKGPGPSRYEISLETFFEQVENDQSGLFSESEEYKELSKEIFRDNEKLAQLL